MSNILILDARVNSYAGPPTRLIATCDVPTGQVYVSAEKPFNPKPSIKSVADALKAKVQQAKTLIITDSPDTLSRWDLLYRESDHLTEIVRSYHAKMRNGLLAIDETVQGRYNPENVLQQRRLDAKTGALWELSTETQNGHICVLLACWGAMRASNNFMFASQLHAKDEDLHLQPDSLDLDEPFSL